MASSGRYLYWPGAANENCLLLMSLRQAQGDRFLWGFRVIGHWSLV